MQDVANLLNPLERKILPHLKDGVTSQELVNFTGLKDVEVVRALQWLENKNVLKAEQEVKEIFLLGKRGEECLVKGLPEKRFLELLKSKERTIKELKDNFSDEELSVCLGLLRRKGAIGLHKDLVKITGVGRELLEGGFLEERVLNKLPTNVESLYEEFNKNVLEDLKKRGLIHESIIKIRKIALTKLGKELVNRAKTEKIPEQIEKLTQDVLAQRVWEKQEFRHYDIKINVPKINFGRKQPYRAFLDGIRKKFVSLGFKEMSGPIVESNFWDMDVLYMPQFHSARDIHDAYFVKEPKYLEVPKELLMRVKNAHERGCRGSRGWRYKFDIQKTKRSLLRTQGTACSARMLASKELEIPGKYFGITRCFRYDVVDATHLCDFNQVEGIVAEEGLNFKHLKTLLEMFAYEFADARNVKIVPGYFPFTEPSAELFAKHPQLGWIELGGSGIFRPEMLESLGVKVPVIAWGLGIDRIAMFKLGLKDIRELFSHNLEFLRNAKVR